MKQYWVFVFTAIGIAILDLVDSAFGNNLGVDSICVMSAFTIITWCMHVVGNLGTNAFNVKQKDVTECLLLQALAGVVVSIFVLAFSRQIPHLYKLTDTQYALFSKCLVWYAAFFTIKEVASFLKNYVALRCKNRVMIISNILFFTVMIALDALVVVNGGECYHLVITTVVSYIALFVYLLPASGILGELEKPNLAKLKEDFSCAKDIVLSGIFGKVATTFFNVAASHLGTRYYVLHGIAYNIATSSEVITNEWYRMQVITLKNIVDKKAKYAKSVELQKRLAVPGILMSYLLMFIMIVPMHGEADLGETLLFSCLYLSQSVLLLGYESRRGLLTSLGATGVLRYNGLVGIVVRIPLTLISLKTVGIWGFAFGSGIDFFVRGLYFKRKIKQIMEEPNATPQLSKPKMQSTGGE